MPDFIQIIKELEAERDHLSEAIEAIRALAANKPRRGRPPKGSVRNPHKGRARLDGARTFRSAEFAKSCKLRRAQRYSCPSDRSYRLFSTTARTEPFGAEIRAKSTELSYTAPDLLPTKFTAQEIRHQSAPECRDSVLQRVTRVPARLSRDVVNGPGPKSFYFTQQGSVYLSCTPIPWKQPFQRFCRLMESISYAFSTPRVGSTPTPGTIVFSKIRPALTPPLLILVGRTSLFPI